MSEEKQKRTVVHVEKDGEHYYFGNVKAIYEKFSKSDIGIAYGTLRNYSINESKPFVNRFVTIRKGTLITIPHKKANE